MGPYSREIHYLTRKNTNYSQEKKYKNYLVHPILSIEVHPIGVVHFWHEIILGLIITKINQRSEILNIADPTPLIVIHELYNGKQNICHSTFYKKLGNRTWMKPSDVTFSPLEWTPLYCIYVISLQIQMKQICKNQILFLSLCEKFHGQHQCKNRSIFKYL